MDTSSQTPSQPIMTMSLGTKNIDNPNLYRWLLEQKDQFKEEVIQFLSKHEKKKTRSLYKVKSEITKSGYITKASPDVEDYMPMAGQQDALMTLDNAKEIATFMADFVDPLASTTYYDPNTKINHLAALFGLMGGQMLDNPRYKFKGNETDAASFTLMICKKMGEVMGRSRGGFLMREVAESTVNYQNQTISPNNPSGGMVSMPKKQSGIESFFRGSRGNQQ